MCVALCGCVSYGGLAPGVSTMWDVRSQAGRPTDVRFVHGEEVWEYATGPEGVETYVIRFDSRGVVQSAEQVLTLENIRRLTPGKTTREETRELLGRPGEVSMMNGKEVWAWRFRPFGFIPEILAVSFGGDGLVTDVARVPESIGGSNQGRK
jgi:outer membrane protein assembly factor BamE (lipoprotein component of BamABCDE complex)